MIRRTILLMIIVTACARQDMVDNPAQYVDPFIGTGGHGHTYPGASLPFGMVQLSPDTRIGGWDGASGYHYSDSVILGFTHTALNGTGVGDYGDILLMPVVGEPELISTGYLSSFRKETEYAKPGYYTVFLDKPGVLAEMTATTRVGFHRYTFPETDSASIIIDLEHRDRVTDSSIEFVSDTEIRGMRRSSNWAKDMVWYFHMEFSKPFDRKAVAIDNEIVDGMTVGHGLNVKAFIGFKTKAGETIEVKVALSAVDAEGALKNLKAEAADRDFDEVEKEARDIWNGELGSIRTGGGSEEQKRVFYTAMYHAFLQPNTFMDVDGRYRGMDRNIHVADGFTNYTVFSLWDTYRAWHPMMTIVDTARSNDFIRVMLNMYEHGGLLPIWELAANETWCMIGNHSLSVIADAYIKGIRGYDTEMALEAMVNSATRNHFGLDVYREQGHIPGNKEHESISKTLEYAYNDWCIAVMAKEMGREDIYREYIRRAQSYKNIFDPSTGFMRPRMNGGWLTPFDPTTVDWHFTEANSWHYSFYVPQDIKGLYLLHGGKEELAQKIDELFETETDISGRDQKDISGLIGQYAQGNEPSHHMAYLYNYVGKPWKTQQRVRQIMDELYTDKPDGLSGNEDCGQMSAWLIMSAMGFYPVTPGSPDYIIGTPWFPEMELQLQNGNVFRITAPNVSARNFYIQSASLNGEEYTKSYITYDQIMKGGELHFTMGSKPNMKWGTAETDLPVTHITEELLLPVPYIESGDRLIRNKVDISMGATDPDCEIYYTLDGTLPDRQSARYDGPLTLTNSAILSAIAWQPDIGYSFPVKAEFIKIDLTRSIDIKSPPQRNYSGGGPEALIDGVRGAINWRLGGWHGYQGKDFEAVVDLGRNRDITWLCAGFVQDVRSWIWMPKDVTFSISSDGENFTEVAKVKNAIADDDYEITLQDMGAPVKVSGRYVHVKASNYGTIPRWHLGAGGNAYIFIDEVIVK